MRRTEDSQVAERRNRRVALITDGSQLAADYELRMRGIYSYMKKAELNVALELGDSTT